MTEKKIKMCRLKAFGSIFGVVFKGEIQLNELIAAVPTIKDA